MDNKFIPKKKTYLVKLNEHSFKLKKNDKELFDTLQCLLTYINLEVYRKMFCFATSNKTDKKTSRTKQAFSIVLADTFDKHYKTLNLVQNIYRK